MEKTKTVKVIALPVEKQHLTIGKVYEVSEETAKALLKNKQAAKAKASMDVGKIYESPKPKASGGDDPTK